MEFPIPNEFQVGGQNIKVILTDQYEGNVGTCCISEGIIKVCKRNISNGINSDSYNNNTFFHELTHAILDTMGENGLSDNETFVSTFSSFLCEAIRTMK